MNLAVNARDAMPSGGMLHLETANVHLDETLCEDTSSGATGSYVMLAVSDTGSGIDKSSLPRIFDPFFTTKPMGQGWVYSEPGQGTTFKLYFPTTDAALEMLPWRTDIAGCATGQTVLVVEDEGTIRGDVRDCLQQLVCAVLEAESGETALEICHQKQGKINLVITYLIMSGIGGQEMARRLGEQYPNVRVLFTSGYTEGTLAQLEVLQEGSSFLPKPYSVADLSSAIHRILALRSFRKNENHANVAAVTPA